jgi:immune inhibitor A
VPTWKVYMRKVRAGAVTLAMAAAAVGVPLTATSSAAAPPVDQGTAVRAGETATRDELPNAREEKRRDLREAALTKVLNGKVKAVKRGASTVVDLGPAAARRNGRGHPAPRYVELAREKTDKIFVVLAEFGDKRATDIDPKYGDVDTNPDIPGPVRFDGPLHNQIPKPDRTQDNSTVWQADYSPAHYQQLYFGKGKGVESLKTYYEKQSSGRYSVDGTVTNWVKVPYNEARYGRSDGFPCASNICGNVYALVRDGINAWVDSQHAKGRTDAQIAKDLKSFDQWDRYDFDGDGNFNEPDGYIDHFQIVHAGGDQSDGDPVYGEDALWAHRSGAYPGTTGPTGNKAGGVQIGNTGLWVYDYTMQPENGGLSVFAHEYGHDLGLPDLYDTRGAGGDSTVGFWSLMAQSRLSAKGEPLGTRPGDLGAWEKLQLGWLDYETVRSDGARTLKLGPHEYNSKDAQAAVVVLPKKPVTTQFGAPHSGQYQYWSGQGDARDAWMARNVTLPAGTATLTFQARWNIEDCGPDACDYAYVEVKDGADWKAVPGSITKAAEGNGIDGYQATWTPATFDLSAYAGKTIGLRVRYLTDGAAQGTDATKPAGIFVDDIALTAGGATLLTDDAESANAGWTFQGFQRVGASQTIQYDNYYIASHRTYLSYDKYLRTGPYNFGYATTKPDWAEHFPYQDGLLVSYWDTSYGDNDVGLHPGHGLILPVDAHPEPIFTLGGQPWRGRVSLYDATFGRQRADSFTLHVNGQANYIRGQKAQPVFDDTRSYYDARAPFSSVIVANAGVRIAVQQETGTTMRIRISPVPKKS